MKPRTPGRAANPVAPDPVLPGVSCHEAFGHLSASGVVRTFLYDLQTDGQGKFLGGDFSGSVVLGYKIEGGEIASRVKGTMVAGNVYSLLARIAGIGSDGRWVGGTVFAPSFMFGRIAVSAER